MQRVAVDGSALITATITEVQQDEEFETPGRTSSSTNSHRQAGDHVQPNIPEYDAESITSQSERTTFEETGDEATRDVDVEEDPVLGRTFRIRKEVARITMAVAISPFSNNFAVGLSSGAIVIWDTEHPGWKFFFVGPQQGRRLPRVLPRWDEARLVGV